MKHKLKRLLYIAVLSILKLFWTICGRRKIKAFGEDFFVTPHTIFPSYRKFSLPKGDCKSEIVRFADYVQLHSLCNCITNSINPVVVEIGAHHGAYAVILGKLTQKRNGRLIAVEPNPQSFTMLKKNVVLNNLDETVICERLAIGDTSGSQYLKLEGSQSRTSKEQDESCCLVEVITLEYLFAKYKINKVDFLIIDVEGAELPVLRSIEWASVNIGMIYCELHPYAWKEFGYSSKDFSLFLRQHNFRAVDMYLHEHVTFDITAYIGPTIFFRGIEYIGSHVE
jgi:FkbM family methyltransferase